MRWVANTILEVMLAENVGRQRYNKQPPNATKACKKPRKPTKHLPTDDEPTDRPTDRPNDRPGTLPRLSTPNLGEKKTRAPPPFLPQKPIHHRYRPFALIPISAPLRFRAPCPHKSRRLQMVGYSRWPQSRCFGFHKQLTPPPEKRRNVDANKGPGIP